jgi:hypothetical protein
MSIQCVRCITKKLENFPGSYFSSILLERGLRNLRYREIEFAGDGSPSETPSGLAKAIANYQRFAKKYRLPIRKELILRAKRSKQCESTPASASERR